ncbi:MAG: site-specific integrase [Bacteroidota bacterium]
MIATNYTQKFPLNYPYKMNGKLTYKIKIKDDFIRKDGTSALYIQLFLNKDRKRLPLDLSVKIDEFDSDKQRCSKKNPNNKDYNLIIEKKLSDINAIEVNYRLSGVPLTLEKLINELDNPTCWIDFIQFWEEELKNQKEKLKPGTLRQQTSALSKLKEYKASILFYELTNDMYDDILLFLKVKKKNNKSTISTFSKNFKKYLNIAQKKGIRISLQPEDIKCKSFRGDRTFLDATEINKMYKYLISEFINDTHKAIINRFLFSCFTGLRISDIQKITNENIIGDYIVFVAEKTEKLQRITLNNSAKKFIDVDALFKGEFTGEYINRVLKDICKITGITKRVSFHVARHTFATNFLISGGRIEVLQKILGHSKIEETMIYVHIVESIKNEQMYNMDDIIKD